MRTGEVFALTWDDIDLDNRIIKISKTVYAKDKEENGRWYLGTTKTIGSQRDVYICDTLYNILLDYKNTQDNYKKQYAKKYKRYVLEEVKNKYGKLVEYKIEENSAIGIKCRFYDLRGSFATISLRNGCEIKDIAEVLGHKRIETTEKYYISSTNDDKENVINKLEQSIGINSD